MTVTVVTAVTTTEVGAAVVAETVIEVAAEEETIGSGTRIEVVMTTVGMIAEAGRVTVTPSTA